MQLIFYKYIRVKVELFNLKEILLQAPEDTGYPWNILKLGIGRKVLFADTVKS